MKLVREVMAPPSRAYATFTEPEHVTRWFMTEVEADLRVGGRYRNADGDTGEYVALDPPHSVSFTWENPGHCPGTRVTVTFAPLGNDASTVVLEHSGLASEGDVEEMRGGWSWALDSYASYLKTGEPIPHEVWLERSRSE